MVAQWLHCRSVHDSGTATSHDRYQGWDMGPDKLSLPAPSSLRLALTGEHGKGHHDWGSSRHLLNRGDLVTPSSTVRLVCQSPHEAVTSLQHSRGCRDVVPAALPGASAARCLARLAGCRFPLAVGRG